MIFPTIHLLLMLLLYSPMSVDILK